MPFKLNPITGLLDLVNATSSGTGNVTGIPPTTVGAIAQWADTTGTTIQNSPGTFVQAGGAIQANAFMTQRNITTDMFVPSGYSWIAPELELEPTGSIELEADGELVIL
jgi:hypothetical protein